MTVGEIISANPCFGAEYSKALICHERALFYAGDVPTEDPIAPLLEYMENDPVKLITTIYFDSFNRLF